MELDKKKIRAIIGTGIIILAIVLVFIIGIVLITIKENQTNTNINIESGYSSIQEIVEYYDCTYEKDTYDETKDYPIEINLIFKYNLYENEESQEDFYNKIIKDIANFVNYTNIKMIDEEKDIEIEIICQDRAIYQIIINGITDYFIYMDSQLELSQYKNIDTISITPDAVTLIDVMDNSWNSDTFFGSRESIFKNYNICFDEGIEYRKIGSEIYNIVYTDKYVGPVINNLSVGIDLTAVEDYLGEPAFEDEELGVIGYKGGNLYAFFTETEISIYRNTEIDYTEFWELCDEFLEEDLSFKDFMNELTYLWGDFSDYTYDSDYMFISYPNKGIDVKLNYDELSGIIIYNNISENLTTVREYLNHTEFISRLKVDNIFEAEKRRITNENNIETSYTEFMQELEEAEDELIEYKKSYLYNYYMDKDVNGYTVTTYFISKNGENVNRELNEAVDTYIWANSENFLYSIYGKGLYIYNVVNGTKTTLVEGNDNFEIDSYKDYILKFDDTNEIKLEY